MRRGIGATAVAAVLALTATACGGDGGSGEAGAKGEIAGTVTYWDTSNDAEKGTYKKIAEDFEKKHPKVDVKYVNVTFGEAQQKFKNAAGGNSGAPDVMRTEVAWVADFANLGYLAPLDGTPALDNESDYLKTAAGSTRSRARPTPCRRSPTPSASSTTRRCCKEAGVRGPQDLRRAEEGRRRRSRARAARPALYLRGDDPYWFLPFLYGEGGDLVDAEGEEGHRRRRAGRRRRSQRSQGPGRLQAGGHRHHATARRTCMKAFQDGDVAMIDQRSVGHRATPSRARSSSDKDNLGVAPVPAGQQAQGAPQGGCNLAVYAGTKNLRRRAGVRQVHELRRDPEAHHRGAEPAARPASPSTTSRPCAGNEMVAVLQAGRRQGRRAPLDPGGQLPLRADPRPDGRQGAHRPAAARRTPPARSATTSASCSRAGSRNTSGGDRPRLTWL